MVIKKHNKPEPMQKRLKKRWEFEKFYLKRIRKSLHNRNLIKTLYLIRDDLYFDLIYGVKTFRLKYIENSNVYSENNGDCYRYESVNFSAFQKAFKYLKTSYPDYNFIDLGCGLGLALILASKYNFKKLIGIEISEELANICQYQLKSFFAKKAEQPPYEIINLDVTKYTFPKDKNLIFMYNPFSAKVMEATFFNFLKTDGLKNNYIVYINARHKDVLLDLGFKMRYFSPKDPLNICQWGIAIFETPTP